MLFTGGEMTERETRKTFHSDARVGLLVELTGKERISSTGERFLRVVKKELLPIVVTRRHRRREKIFDPSESRKWPFYLVVFGRQRRV